VGVSTGVGISVWVGVTGVFDSVGVGGNVEVGTEVLEGVLGGIRVDVGEGPKVGSGLWVLVGSLEGKGVNRVGVLNRPDVGEIVRVSVGDGVEVETYWVITSTVRAAMVLKLENAESTIFCGSMDTGCASFAPARAIAETMQNRLKPRMPIITTVNGAEYSRIFTQITCQRTFA
jgi:hypothetical protein